MNTQTHLFLAAAVLGRRASAREQGAILAGALLPDLSIFVLAVWALTAGIPQEALWGTVYWSPPWQAASMVSNSVPLWSGLLAAGLLTRRRWVALLALAALLHLAFDLPLHAEDAHAHLWPLTQWRFRSPVSYWDPDHHGQIASVLEAAAGLALVLVLWRRHRARRVRVALALCAALYVAVPAYWLSRLG